MLKQMKKQLIIAQMNKILAGAGTLIVFLFKKLISTL